MGALRHEEQLEPAGERGLWAYLRKSVINRIRDELRRSRQGEVALAASDPRRDPEPSPEARLVALEERRRFQAALDRLNPEDQALVIGRVEMRVSCEELAVWLGLASSDAVRMAAKRAVLRLAREMDRLEAELATGHTRIEPSAVSERPSTPS